MKTAKRIIWVAKQRDLGLTTKQIEKKFNKLINLK